MRILRSLRDKLRKKKRQIRTKFNKTKKNIVSLFKKKETAETFTKRKVDLILNHAIIWVYLTYILALIGKESIAENLSITVVKVIIYTFIPYLCKSLFEYIFKYGAFGIGENPYVSENIEADENTSTNTDVTESEDNTSKESSDEEIAG